MAYKRKGWTPEPEEQEQEQVVDEEADVLRQLAELAGKAASDKENRSTILKDVEATLSKISLADAGELANSPVVQNLLKLMGVGDLKPGETRHAGTLAERSRDMTIRDMYKECGEKTFTPYTDEQITINGVGPVHFRTGEEICVPIPFYDRYVEIQRARGHAEQHIKFMLGFSEDVPPLDYQTGASSEIAGISRQGRSIGRLSGFLTYGPINQDGGSDA